MHIFTYKFLTNEPKLTITFTYISPFFPLEFAMSIIKHKARKTELFANIIGFRENEFISIATTITMEHCK